MQVTTLHEGRSLCVYRFSCGAGPADRPFAEVHERHSLSYVRRGSFGCRTLGAEHELAPGALLVGHPGQEYVATHEHYGAGDECLSVKLSPELAQSLAGRDQWSAARLPPLAALTVLGALLDAAARGRVGVAVDEAALLLACKFAELANAPAAPCNVTPAARRRAVAAALWLEAQAAEPVTLEDAAREAGLSPFHFLRVFAAVHGVTPHQYVLRMRLARAAKLLAEESLPVTEVALQAGFADLSNFVRTFGRAAGMTPSEFRAQAANDRKILQARLARVA
jgi:AraC family transcriptional regulator